MKKWKVTDKKGINYTENDQSTRVKIFQFGTIIAEKDIEKITNGRKETFELLLKRKRIEEIKKVKEVKKDK